MKTNKLTKKQETILIYIKKYIAKNDYPPTVREIAKAVNLSSPATVHVHLQNLIEKGYIKRNKKNNRILELLVQNEFLQINNNEKEITLVKNNKKNSNFIILKSSISKYKEVIAFEMDKNEFSLGILKNDILIFEITNEINKKDIVLVKINNNYTIKNNNINIDKVNIIGKLVKLYREY